jgi:FkbM family methyltransferase
MGTKYAKLPRKNQACLIVLTDLEKVYLSFRETKERVVPSDTLADTRISPMDETNRQHERGSRQISPSISKNFMPFISYAQNYEDVILWRALRDVEQGFYVDVGAADPEELSVTHAFYERGWSGINVEPTDEYFQKLILARPRDTNLNIAVGRETGLRTLHVIAGTGLSTLDPEIAAQHRAAGRQTYETVVPVLTLEKILEDCAPVTIHFLKIDVEGVEAEVLEGLNMNRARPWIVVVEAIKPLSSVSSRAEWEYLVTSYGYTFAYFDGLNCFYVADECHELKERLAIPPNVFDDFVRWQERANAQRAEDLEKLETISTVSKYLRTGLEAEKKYTAYLHETLQEHRAQIANLHHLLSAEQAQVAQLTTLPSVDRALGRAAIRLQEMGDRLTGGGVRALAHRVLVLPLRRTLSFAARHPRLAVIPRAMLKPFPRLATAIYRIAEQSDALVANSIVADFAPDEPAGELPPWDDPVVVKLPAVARATYLKLQAALSADDDSPRVP